MLRARVGQLKPSGRTGGRRSILRVVIAAALVASGAAVVGQGPAVANGCPAAAAYDSSNPKGLSAATPIEIQTTAHLLHLAATSGDWSKHFKQTEDLDLTGCTWSPIGGNALNANANELAVSFTGSYDGNGHSITGLIANYNSPAKAEVGMFGYVGGGGVIRGVTLVNATVSGRDRVGLLVGQLLGTIENSAVSGTASASGVSSRADLGGLVGYVNGGTISASSASVEVSGVGESVGGLVGYSDSPITNSFATGDVTGSARVGGLVGESAGNVSNSYATGNVRVPTGGTHDRRWVGGLIGLSGAAVSNVYATGDVLNGGEFVGGLIGQTTANATITEAYASGTVSGVTRVGGLVGQSGAAVERSFATGTVMGQFNVGGLVGVNFNSASIEDSFASGNVEVINGGQYAGGLVGDQSGSVIRSYSTGGVVPLGAAADLGGLAGWSAVTNASFWDVSTSARTDSAGGTGKTTEEMKALATFDTDGGGWDIAALEGVEPVARATVWGLSCNVNDGYPHLVWRYASGYPTYPLTAPCTSPDQGNGQTDNNNGGSTGGEVEIVTPAPEPEGPTPTPEVTTPAPAQVNGALPQMTPGEVVVYEDGVPVSVQVFVEDDTELVIEASTFELRLAGECESGCTVAETEDGRYVLTLEEDGAARTEGTGFQPGSVVDVWLFSTPTYLGQLTVNADGNFVGTVDLAGIEIGEHTLQVNGLSVSGAQRSANMGVLVAGAEALVTPTLPTAGFENLAMPWVLLLLATGGLLVLTSRRTRRI